MSILNVILTVFYYYYYVHQNDLLRTFLKIARDVTVTFKMIINAV